MGTAPNSRSWWQSCSNGWTSRDHTGGGEHLARLIREGYVQALLGGNAIAVHDIEQNLMGTSLGVDMKRGVAVGGHRHHLKVINTRRYGSIAKAVEQGVVKSGVLYECVRNGVPFCLAGSIRMMDRCLIHRWI